MLCISPAHCEISSSVLKSTSGFWEFGGPCVCALRAELGAWQDTPPVMESHTYQKTFQELEIGGSRGGEAASQLCPHSLCWPVFAFFIQEEGKCLIKYCALAFPHFFVFEKVWKMHKLDSDVWQIISGISWEWRDFAVGLPDMLFSRTDRPWVVWFPTSQAPGVQLKHVLEQHCSPLHGKKHYQIIRLCHEDVIKILRKLINAHVQ